MAVRFSRVPTDEMQRQHRKDHGKKIRSDVKEELTEQGVTEALLGKDEYESRV